MYVCVCVYIYIYIYVCMCIYIYIYISTLNINYDIILWYTTLYYNMLYALYLSIWEFLVCMPQDIDVFRSRAVEKEMVISCQDAQNTVLHKFLFRLMIYIYIYIYVYTHVYIYIYIYIYTHVYIYIYIYIYTYTHLHIHILFASKACETASTAVSNG